MANWSERLCQSAPPITTLDPQLFVGTHHRLNPDGRALLLEPTIAVVIDRMGLTR
jgi:hypothetical protein